MNDSSIEVDGIRIFYRVAGNRNNPVLVFLHAWGAQEEWLAPVVSALSESFYVIAPEHPGLIRSQTPNHESSFEWRSHLLNLLFNKLHITEKVILAGSSFGGGVATIFALQYPDKLKSLVLIDSFVSKDYPSTTFVKATHTLYKMLISSKLVPLAAKKYFLQRYVGTPIRFLTKDEIERKIRMIATPKKLTADYSKLSMPVFLIWGNKDRFVHPIKYAQKIVKLIPQGKLIEYNGSVPTLYKQPSKVVPLIKKTI